MNKPVPIDDKLAIGAQPSEDDLAELKRQGFRTIVNLRRAGEANQPLPPEAQAEKARAAGLEHVHIPVAMSEMRPEQVDEFGRAVERSPGPVFVHCGVGARAAVFALAHKGARDRLPAEKVFAEAKAKGIDLSDPVMADFVAGYIDRRS